MLTIKKSRKDRNDPVRTTGSACQRRGFRAGATLSFTAKTPSQTQQHFREQTRGASSGDSCAVESFGSTPSKHRSQVFEVDDATTCTTAHRRLHRRAEP